MKVRKISFLRDFSQKVHWQAAILRFIHHVPCLIFAVYVIFFVSVPALFRVTGAASHVAVFNWLEEQKTTSAIEEVGDHFKINSTGTTFEAIVRGPL